MAAVKPRNLQTSLSILKQVEDKLLGSLSKRNGRDSKMEERDSKGPGDIRDKEARERETPSYRQRQSEASTRERLESVCQCQIRLRSDRIEEQNSKQIANEMKQLRHENRELRRYIQFLEKMNDHLKLQILAWARGSSFPASMAPLDSEITIIKPRKSTSNFETVASENNYLKKINEIQNQEIEKLRRFQSQSQDYTFSDLYDYVTPSRTKFRTQARPRESFPTEYIEPSFAEQPQQDCPTRTKTRTKHRAASISTFSPKPPTFARPQTTTSSQIKKRTKKLCL